MVPISILHRNVNLGLLVVCVVCLCVCCGRRGEHGQCLVAPHLCSRGLPATPSFGWQFQCSKGVSGWRRGPGTYCEGVAASFYCAWAETQMGPLPQPSAKLDIILISFTKSIHSLYLGRRQCTVVQEIC